MEGDAVDVDLLAGQGRGLGESHRVGGDPPDDVTPPPAVTTSARPPHLGQWSGVRDGVLALGIEETPAPIVPE